MGRKTGPAAKEFGIDQALVRQKEGSNAPAQGPGLHGPRVARHSSGWAALRKQLQAEPGLRVIDVGYTSPTNINYLTSLGHSVFMADIVQDACNGKWQMDTDDEGKPIWNVQGFIDSVFNFGDRIFDVVLLWTALDYLPEPFVQPVVEHLHASMNPGGSVLSFFHMKTQGDNTAYCRFHVTEGDEVECSRASPFRFRGRFQTAVLSACLRVGRATGNFLPKTASLKSS